MPRSLLRDRRRLQTPDPHRHAAWPLFSHPVLGSIELLDPEHRRTWKHHLPVAAVHGHPSPRRASPLGGAPDNAIPTSIAERLKHGEKRIAERYPETTVLFSDIVGFTPWAQRTDPDRVVALLDELFTSFDQLAGEHGVEKIKTIGDAYMAVAGAPDRRPDHADAALAMARAMLAGFAAWRTAHAPDLEMRIGLASGSVVAGVIGQRRILFDLWGETVNLASRMESSGLPGRIQVAPSTWMLLRGHEAFEARRPTEIKGLGLMATYLVA